MKKLLLLPLLIIPFLLTGCSQNNLQGTKPVAGSPYNLAGAGVNSSATSIVLQSFTIPQTGQKLVDSDLSDTFYLTIEPGSKTKQEIVACTTVTQGSNSVTLSGCSRGMAPISPYTASTTLAFAHSGGSQVILSDPPQLFEEYASKQNDNTFRGLNEFGTTTEADISFIRIATKTPARIESNAGVLYYCNNGASCAAIGAGANTYAFVAPLTTSGSEVKLGTTTYEWDMTSDSKFSIATGTIANGTASGTGFDDWWNTRLINTTTWASNMTIGGDITISGDLFGVDIGFGGDSSDGALSITTGTTTIDLLGKSVVVLNYSSLSIANESGLTFSNPNAYGTTVILKVSGDVTISGYIDLSGVGAAGGTGGTGGTTAAGTSGTSGKESGLICDDNNHYGSLGAAAADSGSDGAKGTGGVIYSNLFSYTSPTSTRIIRDEYILTPGSGGGGGGGAYSSTAVKAGDGGDGGDGGGALIMEIRGTLIFNGGINISGEDGEDGEDASAISIGGGGGGGGGASGMALIIYEEISTNTGVITAVGGSGGDGGDNDGGVGNDEGPGGGGGAGAGNYSAAGGDGGDGKDNANGDAGSNADGIGAGGGGGGGAGSAAVAKTGGTGGTAGATDSNLYLIVERP